jgi:hypothetical protein
VSPTLDGEETSYFEWLGAGVLELAGPGAAGRNGTMHRADAPPALLTGVRVGFDRERLYVRLDSAAPMVDLFATGLQVSLIFITPPGLRFTVRRQAGRLVSAFWEQRINPPGWRERGPGAAAIAAGQILELAVPLSDLGVGAGGPIAFFVAVLDEKSVERERHPVHQPIEVVAPDALFEARHWRA